jgi:osmotically-inducible protein OsmY
VEAHSRSMSKKSILGLGLFLTALALSAADFDAEIGKKVASFLSSRQEYRNVDFSVEDEIVTLSGKVALWSQRTGLEWSVRNMEHVRRVQNQVALDPPPVSDELLRTRTKKALIGAGFGHLVFQAHQGQVILRGSVRTRSQWVRLGDLARNVEGVREVENLIRVEEE